MTVAAVVCEYNPFHNGHNKQFQQIRRAFGEDTAIVCIMSGNFVQRGEPAIFPKMVRARAAVECGASLVLELPVTCALSSAEGFARGAVEILNRLGVVDCLCFGSETGDTETLLETARLLRSPAFSDRLKLELRERDSFAAARCRALAALGADTSCLERPNDILAVEYCKALLQTGSALRPVSFRRQGDYHAGVPARENPSATSLRRLEDVSQWRDFVPPAAAAVYRDAAVYRRCNGERAMLAVLRSLPEEAFRTVPFGSEGLWRRFFRACRQQSNVDGIIDAVKSKRYARSRIARMCLCAYLGITEQLLQTPPPYVRVLALDEQGRQVLKAAGQAGSIPVIHAGERRRESYFSLEQRCDNLFSLFAPQNQVPDTNLEHKCRVFYKKR